MDPDAWHARHTVHVRTIRAGCEFRLTLARHLTPESLPESQTCSRNLKLAQYRSYDELREKVGRALEYGAHGFAFA